MKQRLSNCLGPYFPHGKSRGVVYRCNQCEACRAVIGSIWQARQVVESVGHADSGFLGLSFNNDFLPVDGSLNKTVVPEFLRRLRFALEGTRLVYRYPNVKPLVNDDPKFRYFYVGEYGDVSMRAHYHASIFGIGAYTIIEKGNRWCRSAFEVLEAAWGFGDIQFDLLSPESAGYVSKYVSKHLYRPADPALNGLLPQFHRQSSNPAIGGSVIESACYDLMTNESVYRKFLLDGFLPGVLRVGGREWHVGGYLEKLWRAGLGVPADVDEARKRAAAREREAFYDAQFAGYVERTGGLRANGDPVDFSDMLREHAAQRLLNSRAIKARRSGS